MTSVSGPERDRDPCPERAGPELPPGDLHVAAGRDDTLELHRPAAIGLAAGWNRGPPGGLLARLAGR
jgi:hypothetical protein